MVVASGLAAAAENNSSQAPLIFTKELILAYMNAVTAGDFTTVVQM
jgi:hypothetical protein